MASSTNSKCDDYKKISTIEELELELAINIYDYLVYNKYFETVSNIDFRDINANLTVETKCKASLNVNAQSQRVRVKICENDIVKLKIQESEEYYCKYQNILLNCRKKFISEPNYESALEIALKIPEIQQTEQQQATIPFIPKDIKMIIAKYIYDFNTAHNFIKATCTPMDNSKDNIAQLALIECSKLELPLIIDLQEDKLNNYIIKFNDINSCFKDKYLAFIIALYKINPIALCAKYTIGIQNSFFYKSIMDIKILEQSEMNATTLESILSYNVFISHLKRIFNEKSIHNEYPSYGELYSSDSNKNIYDILDDVISFSLMGSFIISCDVKV